jgi:2-dehydro-3-deoxyphosphogluconate aldolase / (4S)-4-hydroxy-2-oxoglutarate aldolase
MHKKQRTTDVLLSQKLLPLYYHDSAEVSVGVLNSLYNAGVRIVEYTSRGDNALENFRELKKVAGSLEGMELGIGTIKNRSQAESFIEAGADFIVAPSVNEEVGKTTEAAGLLWIPGCMTPTEIANAEIAGAIIVKIFPGNLLGPDYIKAIKDLFPVMKFMPTGGVEVEKQNLSNWFDAGVCAVGMGSKLISKSAMQNKDYNAIAVLTKKSLEYIKKITE